MAVKITVKCNKCSGWPMIINESPWQLENREWEIMVLGLFMVLRFNYFYYYPLEEESLIPRNSEEEVEIIIQNQKKDSSLCAILFRVSHLQFPATFTYNKLTVQYFSSYLDFFPLM